MIYGANGYTGELIAKDCKRLGLKPVLAGRSDPCRRLAETLGFDYVLFDLKDSKKVAEILKSRGIKAVLHCAGPFSATALPMCEACLDSGAHYLDITGEISVFESVAALSEKAKVSGVALIPGVGFDVVPTDALAAALHNILPDATDLDLCIVTRAQPSAGTVKSTLQGVQQGGRIRRDGVIVTSPVGQLKRVVEAKPGTKSTVVSLPWGDISTAYYTTGIKNITTYMNLSPNVGITAWIGSWIMAIPGVSYLATTLIGATVSGPTEQVRQTSRSYIWGEVKNAKGEVAQGRLECPQGYQITVNASLSAIFRVLSPSSSLAGFYTPSLAFGGPSFCLSLPAVSLQTVKGELP